VLGLLGTGSKSLVLRDVFVPEHRSVMVTDLFAGTPPGALVHPDYPVLHAPRGLLVSDSLPPIAIALGRCALDIAGARLATRVSRGVTRVAGSEVVQMALGEAAAAIDVATTLLHGGRDYSTAEVSSGRRITKAEALRARRDMVYAQHQVGWAVDRLCELAGRLGLRPRRAGCDPSRCDDDPDPPRREPSGGDGSLRQNASLAQRGIDPDAAIR
jgi:hypothetical protein